MSGISENVQTLLSTFEADWATDRKDFPLWAYVPSVWEDCAESWVERTLWSPRQRVRSFRGRSSPFWRYLYGEPDERPEPPPGIETDEPSWPLTPFTLFYDGRAVREIQELIRWEDRPVICVLLETEENNELDEVRAHAPALIQAQVGAVFRAMGGEEVSIPERPAEPDLDELMRDLRRILGEPLVGDGSIPLAERLRLDHVLRFAEADRAEVLPGKTYSDLRSEARERESDEETADLLREPLKAHEVADRLGLRPDLSDGRMTAFSNSTIGQLAEEAEALVQRYRDWDPTDDQRKRLLDLLREESAWTFEPADERAAELLDVRLRDAHFEDLDEEGPDAKAPVLRLLDFHLRWLRFPYLDTPRPSLNKGQTSARAKDLLRKRLPGSPADATLRGYLSGN